MEGRTETEGREGEDGEEVVRGKVGREAMKGAREGGQQRGGVTPSEESAKMEPFSFFNTEGYGHSASS